MPSIRLVNPNSTSAVTERMAAMARRTVEALPSGGWRIEATTTPGAPAIIVDEPGLAVATRCVIDAFDQGLPALDGVILSAFADPGLAQLRSRLQVPVVGIAEAAMREAASFGRFAILSPTPNLFAALRRLATDYGLGAALGEIRALSVTYEALAGGGIDIETVALREIDLLVRNADVGAVVIGGGPLVDAARAIAERSPVPIVEPVPAAVRAVADSLDPGRP